MKVRITDVPIYGQIPAGMSALTEQTVEGHVSLDARSANAHKNRGTFALRVRGDSMIGAHIVDGDIVILENAKDVHDGDIVAALIDGFVKFEHKSKLRLKVSVYADKQEPVAV